MIGFKNGLGSIVKNDMNWDNSDPVTNGEYFLLKMIGQPWELVFDIGANRGEYTEQLKIHAPKSQIISFEPNPAAARQIKKNRRVRIETLAVGRKSGTLTININEADDTQSSTYRQNASTVPMSLPQTCIDLYIKEHGIKKVNFIKIDTEGHELYVLEGARSTLQNQKVDFIQFEYGGTYRDAGVKLEMVYKLLANNYIVCHILPGGIMPLAFSKEIETYRYSNWLAISRSVFEGGVK